MSYFVHESATVDDYRTLSAGVKVWQFTHIRSSASIGTNTIIGSSVYIDEEVQIGQNCKIQNGAYLYSPAILEDGVFIGPRTILTNDRFPRATNIDGTAKSPDDWVKVGVKVQRGASIGAGVICVAPVVIGKWSMVAAGSVVTRNVPNFALVAGNPARFVKWIGRFGYPLTEISTNVFACPKSDDRYELISKSELVLM